MNAININYHMNTINMNVNLIIGIHQDNNLHERNLIYIYEMNNNSVKNNNENIRIAILHNHHHTSSLSNHH